MSRSAAASTYTWQLPVKCLMTGIWASAATRRISPSPPRGIARSMYCGIAKKLADGGAVGRAHQLHGVGRQADFFGRLGQQLDNRLAGMHRFLAAAEDHRVARLHANRRRVGRHVRPRFVDEKHDAQRHADFVDPQAVGPDRLMRMTSPIGSGRSAICSSPAAISSIRLRRQPQAIDLRVGEPIARRGRQIACVGLLDLPRRSRAAARPTAAASRFFTSPSTTSPAAQTPAWPATPRRRSTCRDRVRRRWPWTQYQLRRGRRSTD